jgi:hypothetical protein
MRNRYVARYPIDLLHKVYRAEHGTRYPRATIPAPVISDMNRRWVFSVDNNTNQYVATKKEA